MDILERQHVSSDTNGPHPTTQKSLIPLNIYVIDQWILKKSKVIEDLKHPTAHPLVFSTLKSSL